MRQLPLLALAALFWLAAISTCAAAAGSSRNTASKPGKAGSKSTSRKAPSSDREHVSSATSRRRPATGGSRAVKPSSSKTRPTRPSPTDDFGDFEEALEDEESEDELDLWGEVPRPAPKKPRGSGGGGGGSSSRALVRSSRYGSSTRRGGGGGGGGGGRKIAMPAISTDALTAALKRNLAAAGTRLETARAAATSTGGRLQRKVKMFTSGTWETALLKATWPDDAPPDAALVGQIVYGVRSFRPDMDVTKQSAEHRVFLRKLWAKMREPDWRTKVKSCYILHRVLRELPPRDDAVLKKHMGKLRRERSKRPAGAVGGGGDRPRYFDLAAAVAEVGPAPADARTFGGFVRSYVTYVLRRSQQFGGKFEELQGVGPGSSYEHVISVLVKARKALEAAMACQISADQESEVTLLALQLVCMDAAKLFRLFHAALGWALTEAESGDLFAEADPQAVKEVLADFRAFYDSCHDELSAFLDETEALLDVWGLSCGNLSLPEPLPADVALLSAARSPASAAAAAAAPQSARARAATAPQHRAAAEPAARAARAPEKREKRSAAAEGETQQRSRRGAADAGERRGGSGGGGSGGASKAAASQSAAAPPRSSGGAARPPRPAAAAAAEDVPPARTAAKKKHSGASATASHPPFAQTLQAAAPLAEPEVADRRAHSRSSTQRGAGAGAEGGRALRRVRPTDADGDGAAASGAAAATPRRKRAKLDAAAAAAAAAPPPPQHGGDLQGEGDGEAAAAAPAEEAAPEAAAAAAAIEREIEAAVAEAEAPAAAAAAPARRKKRRRPQRDPSGGEGGAPPSVAQAEAAVEAAHADTAAEAEALIEQEVEAVVADSPGPEAIIEELVAEAEGACDAEGGADGEGGGEGGDAPREGVCAATAAADAGDAAASSE
ncbi:hypothetical protein JKP88DRAFT_266421 [Tribonema minus]|uniref:ENTH domain-containing protein n=1 Tax=Tribonema minus TaxID=303371 RepID=A0A835ZEZ8_9STRA|nr:hypothetical protein JKP88DRAFT_266421 [Tribonema minus]